MDVLSVVSKFIDEFQPLIFENNIVKVLLSVPTLFFVDYRYFGIKALLPLISSECIVA